MERARELYRGESRRRVNINSMKALATPDRIAAVKLVVCQDFEVHPEVLDSANRSANVALARHVAMYLVRELLYEVAPLTQKKTPISYPKIAAAFNRIDHCTVMHAQKRMADLRLDPAFLARIKALRSIAGEKIMLQPQSAIA